MELKDLPSHRRTYMPVLRGKPSEWEALGAVGPSDRLKILPVVELNPDMFLRQPPPIEGAGETPPPRRTLAENQEFARTVIRRFAAQATFAGLRGRLIFDVGYCSRVDFEPLGVRLWNALLTTIAPRTPGLVPAIRFRRWNGGAHQAASVLVNHLAQGAALRLFHEDLVRDDLDGYIERAFQFYELAPENVDLIVDFENDPYVLPYATLSERLPSLDRWRTYTVVAGVFPPDLDQFRPERSPSPLERTEWIEYRKQEDALKASGALRLPAFGDFTTQHGRYRDSVQAPPSYSVRYTDDECFWIYRGYKPNAAANRTGQQFLGHARLLRGSSHFFGRGFSDADQFIYEKGDPTAKLPGNPGTWRTVGINHHISVTLAQLSDPAGTSMHARVAAAARVLATDVGATSAIPLRSALAARRIASSETRRRPPSE